VSCVRKKRKKKKRKIQAKKKKEKFAMVLTRGKIGEFFFGVNGSFLFGEEKKNYANFK
jgi:hypothetical protein